MSSTKSPASGADNEGADGSAEAVLDSDSERATGLRPTLAAAAVVLVFDQLTKIWAVAELSDRTIDLIGSLRLRLIRNTGASFGVGTGLGRWFAVVVLAIVGVVIGYARTVTDRRIQVLLGAIVGGAVGNFVDRVVRAGDGPLSGGVIDFIDLQWWPIFNVADSAVVCGAIGILLLSMRESA